MEIPAYPGSASGTTFEGMFDIDIAAWVKASVCQADTHVHWSGVSCRRLGFSQKRLPDKSFVSDYICSIEMFLDLIKRGLVCEAEKALKGKRFFSDYSWGEIQRTLDARHSRSRVRRKYSQPDSQSYYQFDVDKVTTDNVLVAFSLYGYKYKAENLTLDKHAFYIYADKLCAHVRFRSDWTGGEEALQPLLAALRSPVLDSIRPELTQSLDQLISSTVLTYEPICAELLRLTEKLLRNIHVQRGWKTRGATLDKLIQSTVGNFTVPDNLEQLLKLISRPYRDYVQHGQPLSSTVARTLLSTAMEAIAGIAGVVEDAATSSATLKAQDSIKRGS